MSDDAGRSLASLLTPAGSGAIAVVRINGARVGEFLASHFSKRLAPLRCVHGELREGQATIDDPVVVLHAGGRTADINLHGGPWVVASVMDLLRRDGFEVVESISEGETLLEQEVLASLPHARTEAGIRMLLAQPGAWREFVASNPSPDAMRAVLEDRTLQHLLHPPTVAIIGAPNVGKSTLANQLFAQQRSITANLPGTTRDWVGELANVDGLPVMLIDTPGLRESDDPIEQAAIERSRGVVARADLVIEVIDATNPAPGKLAHGAIRVLNKVDRGNSDVVHDVETVATSAQGIDALRQLVRQSLGCANVTDARAVCWTERQRAILGRALTEPGALKKLEVR